MEIATEIIKQKPVPGFRFLVGIFWSKQIEPIQFY